MAEEVFGRTYAVGITQAVAGDISPAVFAGAVAPADLAGTDVPAIAEKVLSAVAEAWSMADDAEGSPSVIRVSKQLRAVVENIVTVPESIEHSVDKMPSEEGSSPVNIVPLPELVEHSVDKRPREGGSSPVDIVTVPEPIEHSDVRGPLLRLLRVSGWSTRTIPGSGRMVGSAIQMTVIPQLVLGPGDRSPRSKLGKRLWWAPLARRFPGS